MLKRAAILFVIVFGAWIHAAAQTAADALIVLPFVNNNSSDIESNWIGESFAENLSRLLTKRGLDIRANSERKNVQKDLNIPIDSRPTLATSLKIAIRAKATLLVIGSYEIVPDTDGKASLLNVKSSIFKVDGGIVSEDLPQGRRLGFELSDAVGNLQKIQGKLAWEVLDRIDKVLYKTPQVTPWSTASMVEEAESTVPPKANEAFIKALLVPQTNAIAKENYLRNAIRIYAEAKTAEAKGGESKAGDVFSDALLELGHLYLSQRKLDDSASAFERIINEQQKCKDFAAKINGPTRCFEDEYAEAAFYDGLIKLQQGKFEVALGTLRPLAEDLRLVAVNNALGAISVQTARAERNNVPKAAALFKEGTDWLMKAAESSPEDANVRFNYSVALFVTGDFAGAVKQLRGAIYANPKDGESYFMLAKALSELNDPLAAEMNTKAQSLLIEKNRYAKLETEWRTNKSLDSIPMRVIFPSRKDFLTSILSRKQAFSRLQTRENAGDLLAQARSQIKAGQDDEAMATLRRVLASEPMSAESYLLLGKIHLRRGDLEQAISSFKTSVFWDNRLVDAHVSLGKIYVEKGDCMQAKNYAASAAEIDAENQDVIALQRLSERCSK